MHTIKFDRNIYSGLRSFLLQNELEQICFLFCHTIITPDETIYLPKKIIVFPQEQEVQQQSAVGIRLKSDLAHEMSIQFSESDFTAIITCHSHPFDRNEVWFSGVDDRGDKGDTIQFFKDIPKWKEINKKNPSVHFLSMVFGQASIAARIYDRESKKFIPVDLITILEDPIRYIVPTNKKKEAPLSNDLQTIQARQILAFGESGQKIISDLKVTIVGVGGLGSILAEGLARLGVRHFVLIDPDTIDLSNLNRWQGARKNDVGKYKVELCAERLNVMFDGVFVTPVPKDIFCEESVAALKSSDCILGGLDNPETRYFLNRLSCQYLIPYIDSGVVIRTDKGKVGGLVTRMGLVIPGLTRCFDCTGIPFYDQGEVRKFFVDEGTRENLIRGGYIKAGDDIKAPSVYPLNMLASSVALFEFMNLFTGYKPVNWYVCLDYINLLDGKDRKCLSIDDNIERPTGFCLNCTEYIATGDDESLNYFLRRNKTIMLPKVGEYGTEKENF